MKILAVCVFLIGAPLLVSLQAVDYSVFGAVTSNAAGELLFGVTSSNASPTAGYINGFQLTDVPEPNALALFSLATLGILAPRRGRTDRISHSG